MKKKLDHYPNELAYFLIQFQKQIVLRKNGERDSMIPTLCKTLQTEEIPCLCKNTRKNVEVSAK